MCRHSSDSWEFPLRPVHGKRSSPPCVAGLIPGVWLSACQHLLNLWTSRWAAGRWGETVAGRSAHADRRGAEARLTACTIKALRRPCWSFGDLAADLIWPHRWGSFLYFFWSGADNYNHGVRKKRLSCSSAKRFLGFWISFSRFLPVNVAV